MNDHNHETIVELLPAYVLGALDPDELGFVEEYLAAHPDMHGEVEELRETLGLLAFAAPPLAPRPGAKAALLARVEQLAAPASVQAAPVPVQREPLPLRAPATGTVPFERRWRIAYAAVAAAVIFALVGWNVALQRQIGTVEGQVTTLNSQLGAQADSVALGRLVGDQRFARALSSSVSGSYGASGPAGYTYLDLQSNLGLLNCYWMPGLAPNQVYQVWLVRADGRRDNGGAFTVDARGNASVVIHAPANFGTYTTIGVTTEPAPGSTGPTTPRVIWADLN